LAIWRQIRQIAKLKPRKSFPLYGTYFIDGLHSIFSLWQLEGKAAW